MRLAFDTACQRPEGWSRSRQPDRRIISGIRSKTLLRPGTDGEYPGKRGSRHHVWNGIQARIPFTKKISPFILPLRSNTGQRFGFVTIKPLVRLPNESDEVSIGFEPCYSTIIDAFESKRSWTRSTSFFRGLYHSESLNLSSSNRYRCGPCRNFSCFGN